MERRESHIVNMHGPSSCTETSAELGGACLQCTQPSLSIHTCARLLTIEPDNKQVSAAAAAAGSSAAHI